MSHAEALEMASYNRDASSIMISDCNRKYVMNQIRKSFQAFEISEEEMKFYVENCRLNEINLFLLNTFYSGRFKDSYATLAVNRVDTIYLLLGMKKYLEYHRMPLLAQIITANISGKYKVNLVKNSKFLDRIMASNVYQRIIADKFEYVNELDPKENPIIKYLSIIINCEFELVDPNEELNGQTIKDVTSDEMAAEFLLFLSII